MHSLRMRASSPKLLPSSANVQIYNDDECHTDIRTDVYSIYYALLIKLEQVLEIGQ